MGWRGRALKKLAAEKEELKIIKKIDGFIFLNFREFG